MSTLVVTGASAGLGKAIAARFLAEGYNVVMNSTNREKLEAAHNALGAPSNAVTYAGSVADARVGQEMVDLAVRTFGSVDVLVNSAGIFESKAFLEVTEADLDRQWSVNLKGMFFTTQAAIRQMLRQKGGAVINIGAALAEYAIVGSDGTASMATKGGVHALTRHLAAEFGKHNIRVNTIAPGVVRTTLQEKLGVADPDAMAPLHLLNRIGEPESVAHAAHYLATDPFVTGTTLYVDGGYTAGRFPPR